MIVKHMIERHTYLHDKVFDKKPKDRKESDIQELLIYENKEVELK